MAEAVYLLCAVMSCLCAALLLRSYLRTRSRLLLWSSLTFIGLVVNNAVLFLDLVILPDSIDLSLLRSITGALALLPLLFGLVWDSR